MCLSKHPTKYLTDEATIRTSRDLMANIEFTQGLLPELQIHIGQVIYTYVVGLENGSGELCDRGLSGK